MDLFKLMNQMGMFVASYDKGGDWIELWNAWIYTGVKVKECYRPLLMAIIRELADMDRKVLSEVVSANIEGREL
mgnify:CR=1 FL=1